MRSVVVDLSPHNTVVSFPQVKENAVVGVIHEATPGRNFVDARYHARRQRSLDAGLLCVACHFATKGNVAQQVDHSLTTTDPTDTDLLVLDLEPNGESGTMTSSQAEQFASLANQKIGRHPGLYSGQAFLRKKVGNNRTTVLKNCFLWIARYSSQPLQYRTRGCSGNTPRQLQRPAASGPRNWPL